MKISMLASGSSGNVTYIETPKKKILVDAGLSGKKIEQLLQRINRNIADVDCIFVTHEHKDHIHGVGVLARKYGMDIYANEKTWTELDRLVGKIDVSQKHIFKMGTRMTLGDVDIISYGVSHDAIAPQFYAFEKDHKNFVMLTDTGYVSQYLRDALTNATAYLMESNHDVDLLRAGSYPWSTKQRILSDKGHLSNEDGALAVSDMLGYHTKQIYLGHLSKENNIKTLANETFSHVLKEKGHAVNHDFVIRDTDPDEPTTLFTL
ncbi:MBL fold metallo-hydrolase [Carnobacteriaceae bacterium zg-84]|uniref:MBL fold metallo-hydrolase n=1 Tax=Granulicatella sp. zg-84 TaxID=2678503 RepID=UPI0013C0218B|nr:MBL fold metallo-hydrolase [Granulicatella sp. zg-84]NEW66274.1 MBL fold metallo-hydrolase [Granulicatella sp. zg-84]QMI85638.1 MBL fold metallo-hydrolase [Carnobacteriaceae bacterium zg-84]